jgi:hypothetical protein
MKIVRFWRNLRRRWRAINSEARYEAEQKMVPHHLKRDYRFVRVVMIGEGMTEVPALTPVKSAEQFINGVRESFRRTPGMYLQDESGLVNLEDTIDAMFVETNFVDACLDFRFYQLAVKLLNRPRLQGLPLPALPRWKDDDWRSVDGPPDGRQDIGAEL